MPKTNKRDFHLFISDFSKSSLNKNPFKELYKIIWFFIGIIFYKTTSSLSSKYNNNKITKQNAHARKRYPQTYLKDNNYFEIAIVNQTRTVTFFENKFSFSHLIEEGDLLIFGLAPTIDEKNLGKIDSWSFEFKLESESKLESSEYYSGEFPFNKRTECFAYFPDNGWIDFKLDLKSFVGQICNFELTVKTSKNDKTISSLSEFSISNPQILKGNEKHKNIILISGESLTDLSFLKNHYPECSTPNIDQLMDDSIVYPKTYSPADNTLSYGASILSGLMPSQHGIGNYSKMPWNFDNEILNSKLVNLPEILKDFGFLNIFGGTETRFSSKLGWSKGFDYYHHVFEKWSINTPKVDWIHRVLENFGQFKKFIMIHLDFLHEPLVSFNDIESPRVFDLSMISETKNDNTRKLYFEQLKSMDYQLGILINDLKRKKIYDDTGIIITGDHGAGINWVKHNVYSFYEERIRVPLIVKYPNWSKGTLESKKISNSCFEIYKIISSILGTDIPYYLNDLPQYSKKYSEYAFTETIMNPNKEFKSHKIAITNDNYKYVVGNKIDWKTSKIEDRFIDEKLFLWDDNLNSFDEQNNQAKHLKDKIKKYQEMTTDIMNTNLDFHTRNKPELY